MKMRGRKVELTADTMDEAKITKKVRYRDDDQLRLFVWMRSQSDRATPAAPRPSKAAEFAGLPAEPRLGSGKPVHAGVLLEVNAPTSSRGRQSGAKQLEYYF